LILENEEGFNWSFEIFSFFIDHVLKPGFLPDELADFTIGDAVTSLDKFINQRFVRISEEGTSHLCLFVEHLWQLIDLLLHLLAEELLETHVFS
jgi:hypothetical protein